MNAPHRRGACPALAAPMPTGDGLLARLRPVGTVPLAAFAALCHAARRYGNGIIEVTSRGSVQVRGLTSASAPRFAAEVAALAIDGGDGIAVSTNPLAGIDALEIVDPGPLAAAIRRAARSLVLAPKICVVVDGGGPLHLDDLAADIRLTAAPGPRWHVAVGGDAARATPLGMIGMEDAAHLVLRLLEVIAARGPLARARDLLREGTDVFHAALRDHLIEAPPLPARTPAQLVGVHELKNGRLALGVALAFGHADAPALIGLADATMRAGADGLRAAPGRVLLLLGLARDRVAALQSEAARLGLIVQPDDPRRHVVACAGAPACASARLSTRTLAPELAVAAGALLDGSLVLHLSGCAKDCAHPGAAALTIVGEHDRCAIILNGAPTGPSLTMVDADAIPKNLARLAAAVQTTGGPAAAALSRLGPGRVATVLGDRDG